VPKKLQKFHGNLADEMASHKRVMQM